jgi:hypothetical protein
MSRSTHMNSYLAEAVSGRDALEDDLLLPSRTMSNNPLGVNTSPEGELVLPNQGGEAFERQITLTPDERNTGLLSTNYGHDFLFNRVWVQPLDLDLQFIVEDIQREIKVWNAWIDRSIQMTAVTVIDQQGTDLTYPSLPDTLQKFGDTIYTMDIYQDGPPLQNTSWTLTIDGNDYTITVTGIRVIPFFPDMNWEADPEISYEFNTTIFSTDHLREQRRPLSEVSWFNFSFAFDTSADAGRKIFNLLSYGHDKVFGIPVYNEKFTISSLTTTSITVNEDPTYYYAMQNASYVIIVDHLAELAEVKAIGSLVGSVISFDQNIAESFNASSTYVYPCAFAVLNAYQATGETDDFENIKIELREYKDG